MLVKDPTTITELFQGSHSPDSQMCLMEAVAFVAGESWSDHPECTCPVLAAYGRGLNDGMPDKQRNRLLPYITRLIGARGTLEVERERAFILADAAVRVFAPSALRNAGFHSEAATLEALPPIDTSRVARSAERAARRATWSAAWSAESAAWSAAWSAESAAWSAAWSAARSTERAAWSAESAAWSAAWSAESATWDKALETFDRAIAVGAPL